MDGGFQESFAHLSYIFYFKIVQVRKLKYISLFFSRSFKICKRHMQGSLAEHSVLLPLFQNDFICMFRV
jgi:hypothetical protein